MAPSEAQLQEMLDEFQLRKLVHGYCRAVDRGDVDHLRDLYHPDATDDHGAVATGSADELLDAIAAARPYIRSMQHNVTTVNFAIDGSTAEGEIYTIATHVQRGRSGRRRHGRRTLPRHVREAGWHVEVQPADDRHRLGPRERPVLG